MTIKSLLNWKGFGGETENSQVPIERWHSNGGWEHKAHGHGHGHGYWKGGSKGGSGNAVFSALALLAFLFLINVMQQSLRDNNSTAPMTPTTAVLIREDEKPILLTDREDKMVIESREIRSVGLDNMNKLTDKKKKN